MVMQEGEDMPIEVPVEKETKYVVVKNHIRELPIEESMSEKARDKAEIKESEIVKSKEKNKKNKRNKNLAACSEFEPTEISESDIEELRTLYTKCKAVIRKIETKYGHLLNIDNNTTGRHSKRKNSSEGSEYEECSCTFNKKIIFDENGQQIIKDIGVQSHICPKYLRNTKSRGSFTQSLRNANVQMEVDDYFNVVLTDDLVELGNILKDHNIDAHYRAKVIEKIHCVRQDYLHQLRFERQSLLQKLKENPDDILDFNCTNLSTLPGYPSKPFTDKKQN